LVLAGGVSSADARRMRRCHLPRFVVLIAIAGLAAFVSPAAATPAYTGHRLYAVSSGNGAHTLVPFDIDSGGQPHERSDQAVAVRAATTGLLVDREARSVFVSSRGTFDFQTFSIIPGVIEVFTVGADGALTLAQTVASSSFTIGLAPDGSLFAQQMNGEIDSYPVQADGTLGARRTFYPFTQPATMFAVSPDGKTLYMDGQNGLWFQWTIEADWSLTSLAPGQWGPPGPQCYAPFIGLAVGSSNVELKCSYGDGFTLAPGVHGEVTSPSGTFAGPGGWNGNAEDARGRAFYSSSGDPSVYQFRRQLDGTLAPYALPSVPSSAQISLLAADPDGATLTATTSNSFLTYTIAADGSLSAGPVATTPITMTTPGFVAYSPQQAPTAAFSATELANGSTTFDAGASHALGGQTIARYDWNFGDGTSLADAGPTPSHTYADTSDHTANVTVTDSAGCSLASSFGGSMTLCAGAPRATASKVVKVAPAAPLAEAASTSSPSSPSETSDTSGPTQAGRTEAERPTAASAAPTGSGKKLLLTWAPPATGATGYLVAWSTLHSSHGPGDRNMHHLRVSGRAHVVLRTKPHTTLHLAVYAYGADGSLTRGTKTTVRLP
jgi:hypothetical protein